MKLNHLIKPMVITLACAATFSANAHEHKHEAEKEYNYATIKGGVVSPTSMSGNSGLNTGDTTYTTGFSVGRKFQERFAVELEYMYRGKNTSRSYDASSNAGDNNSYWSASSNTFMTNLSADLIEHSKITPYVKAGIGMSVNKAYDYVYYDDDVVGTSTYSGKTQNQFAWQAGAGLNMKTTEMLDTQLQYMFIDRGRIKTKENYVTSNNGETVSSSARTGRLREHVVTAGLTIKF